MARNKTIANPGGAWTAGASWSPAVADPDSQIAVDMVNTSGGNLVPGDVVISADVNGLNATTTAVANDIRVIGVVGEPPAGAGPQPAASSGFVYAAGAVMPVVVHGPARINIGANVVALADFLTPSGTVKQASTPAAAASVAALQAMIGSFIARALEASAAKDANNTIRCWVGRA